jgi:hypothetical protein
VFLIDSKNDLQELSVTPKSLISNGSPTDGAKRIRTADPLNAIEMRYQLRYSPLLVQLMYDRAKLHLCQTQITFITK